MPSVPGVSHQEAVRALQKAGFNIIRQGKHIVMSNGQRILTIPREPGQRVVNGRIVKDAGLSVEEFNRLP